MKLTRRRFDTPVGPMLALASDEALCALEFWRPGRMSRLDERLQRWFDPHVVEDGTNGVITRTGEWLDQYFAGAEPIDVPLEMRGAPFELRVWAALRAIPRGHTVSYGEIARQVGAPGASRAVGTAHGANPIAIIVPCHRVIGANGTLTGYGGGLDVKARLLNLETQGRFAAAGRLPLGG